MIKIIVISKAEGEQHKFHALLSSQSDFEVLGVGKDAYDALKLVKSSRPNIVILDSGLDDADGCDLIPLIKSKFPETAAVLFTHFDDQKTIWNAITNGASAYLLKEYDTDPNMLCQVIRTVYHGGCFISSKVTARIRPVLSPQKPAHIPAGISTMEALIMAYIAEGCSTEEIAAKLALSNGTIRNYISSIMRKTGLHNRNQVALFALKCKLVSL